MFTIIMPVYNSEDTIKDSVQSIINQTYNEWKLILVDDGSTDNTGKICDDYSNKYHNITAIHKENEGPASARNEALPYITEEYTIFVDADDRLDEKALETLSRKIEKSKTDLIIYSYSNDERIEQKVSTREIRRVGNRYYNDNDEFKCDYIMLDDSFMTFPIWNKAYKSEIIKKYKIVFPLGIDVAEDFIFNLRVFERISSVQTIEKPLYHYIFEANSSITQQFKKNKLETFKKVYYLSTEILDRWLPKAINNIKNIFLHEINIYVNNMFNNNCNLSKQEKRMLVKEMVNDQEIRKIIRDVKPNNNRRKIVKFLFMNKCVTAFLLVGKISRIGKSY